MLDIEARKNRRGCLFRLPIDRERTQPGGRVYLSTDDANITDWIESALHGVELRMSESGKIYAKGQNGLTGDLAVIFGRYPQAGGAPAALDPLRHQRVEAVSRRPEGEAIQADAGDQGPDA